MSPLTLLAREIGYRKLNFALGAAAVAVAAAVFVSGPTILAAYSRSTRDQLADLSRSADAELARLEDDTRKIMLKLGFNLRIVHRDTDLARLRTEFVAVDMPEEYVEILARSPQLTKIAHLVATLQQLIRFEGRRRLLVGYAPEAVQPNAPEKKPIGLSIERGTVVLGHEAGIGRRAGDSVEILGRTFRVAAILGERDSNDDIMIAMNLRDAQELLNKPGKVTEILAVNCRCETVDRLGEIRAQLERVLPQAKVTESETRAVARAEQRESVRKARQQALADLARRRGEMEAILADLSAVVTPLAIAAAGVWVGVLAWINVRERRTEIGLFRALGRSSATIAGLFLGKAAVLGFVGGAAGCATGFALARFAAQALFDMDPAGLSYSWSLAAAALFGAPVVAAVASYFPTLVALLQDPSVVLRDA
jgi:hypothetical protein